MKMLGCISSVFEVYRGNTMKFRLFIIQSTVVTVCSGFFRGAPLPMIYGCETLKELGGRAMV